MRCSDFRNEHNGGKEWRLFIAIKPGPTPYAANVIGVSLLSGDLRPISNKISFLRFLHFIYHEGVFVDPTTGDLFRVHDVMGTAIT